MPLSGKIYCAASLSLVGTVDPPARFDLDPATKVAWEILSGTGSGQADRLWYDKDRPLAASASEDLDLAGGLTDALGVACTFAKIKGIIVKAAAGNTNNVLVGGAASNQLAGLFGNVNDVMVVRPGGNFMWLDPLAGITVTASTGDLLKIANSSSGSQVLFDITLIGTSA